MKSLISKGIYEEPEWLSDGQSGVAKRIKTADRLLVNRGKGPDTQHSAD